MKSDLFVRPTNTDGYSVSIAEVIYFKVPAIASDVCARPQGTVLFKSRDIDDFYLKVKDVLSNHQKAVSRLKKVRNRNCVNEIIDIYKKTLHSLLKL